MALTTLDINADVGEGFGNWRAGPDEQIMRHITTANVACGFHASDPLIMEQTVAVAKSYGIALGAHPGLPDLMGFGRRRMNITPAEAHAYVLYQVGALEVLARVIGVPLHHVKPHGAMYWMVNEEERIAEAVLSAIAEAYPAGTFYWPAPVPRAVLRIADRLGLRTVGEFYIDLRYDSAARLIIERQNPPVDVDAAVDRARTFVLQDRIEAADGSTLRFSAESLCIHGDGPNALELLVAVRASLSREGIQFVAVST
jgi:5-oxoprolinase (ATP-hydrolysing) subunit A